MEPEVPMRLRWAGLYERTGRCRIDMPLLRCLLPCAEEKGETIQGEGTGRTTVQEPNLQVFTGTKSVRSGKGEDSRLSIKEKVRSLAYPKLNFTACMIINSLN